MFSIFQFLYFYKIYFKITKIAKITNFRVSGPNCLKPLKTPFSKKCDFSRTSVFGGVKFLERPKGIVPFLAKNGILEPFFWNDPKELDTEMAQKRHFWDFTEGS